MSKPSLAIGIHFGTTHCCVAIQRSQKQAAEVISNSMGKKTTPSYVAYDIDDDEDDIFVGQTAKDLAILNLENTIFDIRNLIGRRFYGYIQRYNHLWPFHLVNIQGLVGVKIRDQKLLPQTIATQLVSHLKKTAEEYLDSSIDSATVTVPVFYNQLQKDVTREACQSAGLTKVHFITELEAAAIAYGIMSDVKVGETKTCLIFDLGGRTFDVTIFTVNFNKQVEIKAMGGDCRLGGEDFNDLLTEYCIKEFEKKHGIDLAKGKDSEDPKVWKKAVRKLRQIRNACEKQKRFLSSTKKVVVSLDGLVQDIPMAVLITREKFEDLIAGHLEKCILTLDHTLKKNGYEKGQIEEVIIVGGSARIPKVMEVVSNYFRGKRLYREIDPDEALAIGAAIHACSSFHGSKSTLLHMKRSVRESHENEMGEAVETDQGKTLADTTNDLGQRIKTSLGFLCKNSVNLSEVLVHLFSHDVLSQHESDVIEHQSSNYDRFRKLFTFIIPKVGHANMSQHFVNAFQQSGNEQILLRLNLR